MKGYIISVTEKKTGKKFGVGYMMNQDYLGEEWLTEDPTEIRVYWDKKEVEEDKGFFVEYNLKNSKNYKVEVTELDIPIPFEPNPKKLYSVEVETWGHTVKHNFYIRASSAENAEKAATRMATCDVVDVSARLIENVTEVD